MGNAARQMAGRAFSPIVLLGDLPLTYPYTAPAAGSYIPEGLSSPAALAQRQKCPAWPGMRGNAGQSSGCVSMIS